MAYADADYASTATDKRTVFGWAVMCAGACVYRLSKDSGVRDAFDNRGRVRATGRRHHGGDSFAVRAEFILPGVGYTCITGFEDDKGARHLDHNPVCASNLKHIDIRYDLLRELVFRVEFDIVSVESEQQHADFLTKALAGPGFRFHRVL